MRSTPYAIQPIKPASSERANFLGNTRPWGKPRGSGDACDPAVHLELVAQLASAGGRGQRDVDGDAWAHDETAEEVSDHSVAMMAIWSPIANKGGIYSRAVLPIHTVI